MKTIEEKCFDLLEKTNLNWSVTKEPLISTVTGRTTNSNGIYRPETDGWLGTVGRDYIPLQNSELAMILLNAIEGLDIELTQGGQLKLGKKVYLQAELPKEIIGNSDVKRWVTCLNAHDGTISVGFGSTNTTVICANTYFRAYGEVQKFRHTKTMKERIEVAKEELRKTIMKDDSLMVEFKRMANLPLRDEAIERVLNKVFKLEKDTSQSEISAQKKNRIVDFADSLQTSINEQGKTIWALFNGITRYTNHITAPKDIIKKMDYLMLSGGMEIMNNSFDVLKKYTDEQTPKMQYITLNN
jgi:phage/plasmid-like protein (TIGR03299 family)